MNGSRVNLGFVAFVGNCFVFPVPEQLQLWQGRHSPLHSRYSHFSAHFASFGAFGSPYILNTSRSVAIDSGSSYILNPPLIWRFRVIIYITHNTSFGETGSSCIFDTPPHLAIQVRHHHHISTYILHTFFDLAIPVHHRSLTRPLICRFRCIIYLKHAPFFLAVHHIS